MSYVPRSKKVETILLKTRSLRNWHEKREGFKHELFAILEITALPFLHQYKRQRGLHGRDYRRSPREMRFSSHPRKTARARHWAIWCREIHLFTAFFKGQELATTLRKLGRHQLEMRRSRNGADSHFKRIVRVSRRTKFTTRLLVKNK